MFTDVEGSTTLLQELGTEAYAKKLAEHRRIVRKACTAQGGVEVDTQGDAFFVAFPTAPGAVEAARAITGELASGPITLRVGLHTGIPLLTEEGYVGEDVHFAARVAASAHGGQIVLSSATRILLDERYPLVELGEHRLRNILEHVAIFQLGDGHFPPLRTISNTNLPQPASSFVGRERELSELLARIDAGARLVTLTGPGGSGKTRLALEAAASLVSRYKAGVFWVGLASIRDAALVSETIGHTLGAKGGVADHVGERELLLVIDNFDHVVEAALDLSALLRECANLRLLVTSRELLRIDGEVEYPVPPLATQEAVALFCARAQLEVDETITALCRRLDNLPLGIELAAARTAVLSPAQIVERLSERLDLLSGGRDAEVRQRTLRATIEWSHDLLTCEERRLFARLAIFASGCTLEAAEEVCAADLDTLQSLVDKSLVRHTDERFWMLETISDFAVERAEESSEADELGRKHAAYFLELFEANDDARRRGRQTLADYVGLVLGETDNTRRALDWYRATGDADRTARLAVALHPLWMAHATEGRRVLDDLLKQNTVTGDLRGRALWAAWTIAHAASDGASQKRYLEEALPLYARLGDRALLAEALRMLGGLAIADNDFERARELLNESAKIAADIGDRRQVAATATAQAHIPLYQGDYEQAEVLFEDVLQRAREAEDPAHVKVALTNLGYTVFAQGRLTRAASLFRASLAVRVELTRSSADEAIDGIAAIAAVRGDAATAARLLGATTEWRRKVGHRQEPFEAAILERTVSAAQRALGEPVYRGLAEEGAALALDEAVELALAAVPEREP